MVSGSADAVGKILIVGDHENIGGGLTAATATISLVPMFNETTAIVAANGGVTVHGWRCGLGADGTTIPSKFLPASCRGTYP